MICINVIAVSVNNKLQTVIVSVLLWLYYGDGVYPTSPKLGFL